MGPDNRIYFTVEDMIPINDRHYRSRSRIASVNADGSDLDPVWASDPRHSYRHPISGRGDEILFGRFALDGKQQILWGRNVRTGKTRYIADRVLHAVYPGSDGNGLYYLDGGGSAFPESRVGV
jgi:hypothetical protein